MPLTTNSNYRPDIDGLRAIAVLSVILFHINKSILPGGFIGVDIFFVISGFLISRNIMQDLKRGRFSIADFYRRRIKRIAPPLLLVVAVTFVAAQLFILPVDAEKTAESALWSLFPLANVYFWLYQDTSYFAAANNQTLLLHLWSLGIEEQFYIFWPLLLRLFYRRSGALSLLTAMALISLSSYALGEALFQQAPSFVYYMLPTRAGELLLGAVAALAVLHGFVPKASKTAALSMAIPGFLLLGFPLFMLSEEAVFPGFLAIPPTLGTALLIIAGHCHNNPLSRCLSAKPLVWVGLVSYSAYLWHWPLLAFLRYGNHEIDWRIGLAVIAATFLLSWATYHFIERPARASVASTIQILLRQYLVPVGALAFLVLVAMKVDGYGFRYLSSQYKADLDSIYREVRPAYSYRYVCQRERIAPEDIDDERCIVGSGDANSPQVLLWGDSNAAHFVGMIGAFAKEEGFQFRNLEVGSCPPLFSDPEPFVSAKRLQDCRNSNEIIKPAIQSSSVVIISANWIGYQQRSSRFLDAFFDTIRELTAQGKLVILIGKVPIISNYDRFCKAKALSYPLIHCSDSSSKPSKGIIDINKKLSAFAERTVNVSYYDVTPYLCPDQLCSAFDPDGKSIYFDSSHLTITGSWDLGDKILKQGGVPPAFRLIRYWPALRTPIASSEATNSNYD